MPEELLERHPFPGPGLAIRCLCSEFDAPVRRRTEGCILPVHSVGVQGDSRSYAPVLAIEELDQDRATELINRDRRDQSRGGAGGDARAAGRRCRCAPVDADARTGWSGCAGPMPSCGGSRRRAASSSQIWQFPVVLIPLGTAARPDSVVLRPVDSVDGMTAQSVTMPAALLDAMARELLAVEGVCGVFYDLTHKPPATIEWE